MRLTIIGCTGSMSGKDAAASSYLLQAEAPDEEGAIRTYSLIFDIGPGAMGQSLRYINPASLDGIVISHMHADHIADIVGMQVYRRWHPDGPLGQIPVITPGDGAARVRGISADPEFEDYTGEFKFLAAKAGNILRLGPFTMEFFPAWHTIEAYCIRLRGPRENDSQKESIFTYTGDTDYCEGAVQAAQDADLLLTEAAFETGRDTVRGVHMTGVRAGELARDAQAKRVVLTHLQPWTSRELAYKDVSAIYSGDISIAAPGKVYEF